MDITGLIDFIFKIEWVFGIMVAFLKHFDIQKIHMVVFTKL